MKQNIFQSMKHSLILYVRALAACITLSVPLVVEAQELGATFSAQTKNGVIMTFQLVDTVEMNIQVGTWDGAPAIDTQTLGQVNIPNSAGGMKVVAIAPGAFMGCAGVTAVSIPANVASIGDRAFAGMLSLDTLVVSTTNAVFDSRNDCNAVVETATNTLIVGCRSSRIDPTVTAIGPSAFEGSGISNVMLSADITSIGDSAFAGCDSLSLITSLSLTPFAVNKNCFSNQESVELYVPLGSKAAYMLTEGWNSIEHIYEIGAPTEFTDYQGVRYLPQYLGGSYVYTVVRLNEIHTDEIVIPSTVNDYPVTAIGDTAFADRTGLSSITIPASIENIGDQAFVGCDMMTLTILRSDPPMTATTAFDNTENKTLLVPLGSRTTYASVEPWSQFSNIEALGAPKLAKIDGVIYTPMVEGDTYTYTISGNEGDISGTLTLRSDVGGYPVTAIAAEAFKDCTGLTGILTLPSSLISIGDLAFMGCTGLTSSVNIPASVTEIGLNPFAGSTGIKAFSVDAGNTVYDSRNNSNTIVHTGTNTLIAGGSGSQFPDDIVAIAPYAFYNQISLLAITIPEGVASIGEKAFYGCNQITQVRVLAPMPPAITEDAFSCYDIATLSVVKGSKSTYSGAIGWQDFSHISEIGVPEEYRDGQGVDYTPYEINDTYAYAVTGHQTAMPANITIPDNINGYLVDRIEANAFNNCKTLSSMTLPENLLYIGESAFKDCSNMTTVYIPASTISIGTSAFSGCKHLLSVNIPSSTTYIGADAFLGSSALGTITVDGGNMIYDSRDGCNAIIETSTNTLLYGSGSTVIPSSITAIAENAFYGNTVLTSVTIPYGVTYIGPNAFNGCNALTVVNCELTIPPTITEGTFTNLNYLSLNVPLGSKSLYAAAPVWQDFATIDDGAPISPDFYQLAYIVEGDTIETHQIIEGQQITPIAEPQREGYSFSGWSGIPATMPANDVVVTGSFTINQYKIEYVVDDDIIKSETLDYASKITPLADLEKEGYTFSGWSEIPDTMPARDVTVRGSFIINYYIVTFVLDGAVVRRDSLAYGSAITVPEVSERVNYKFSGWGETVAQVVPASDLTYSGRYISLDPTPEEPGTFVTPGNVEETLAQDTTAPEELEDVTLRGQLNGEDLSYLRSLNLTRIDLSGCDIVADSITTAGKITAEANTVSADIFSGLTSLEEVVLPGTTKEVKTAAFANCPNLKVVIWNGEAPINADCFDAPENYESNLLVFAPEGIESTFEGNVIKGNVAERITLTDGKELFNPQTFTAKRVTYTRNFSKLTAIGQAGGWESLVVPFNVQTIVSAERGVLVPFGGSAYGEETTETRPFWLATYDEVMGFTAATSIKANTPYIIAMPNNEIYPEDYCITGDVTFISENVEVQPTDKAQTVKGSTYSMIPSYAITEAADNHYMLNDFDYQDSDKSYMPGAIFVRGYRAARPFEAYMATEGAGIKAFISIADVANSLEKIMGSHLLPSSSNVYDLGGRKIGNNALKQTTRNIYLKDGKKILSK